MSQTLEKPISWLTDEDLELFCKALHRVYWNHTSVHKPRMSCYDFEMLARIQDACALRISEALSLQVDDFDLDSMILTLHHTKTGWRKHASCGGGGCVDCDFKGKVRSDQMTTIKPISGLKRWLGFKTGRVFPIHRNTALNYYKEAILEAGLKVMIPQRNRIIKNGSTHMLRRSASMKMKSLGASDAIRRVKLRHKGDPLSHYDTDIIDLQEWETNN